MRLLQNILIDAFFLLCFYTVFNQNQYFEIAEKVILFFFWVQAMIGCFALCCGDGFVEKVGKSIDLKKLKKTDLHQHYQEIMILIELVCLLAIGMNWLAGFYLLGFWGIRNVSDKVLKLHVSGGTNEKEKS